VRLQMAEVQFICDIRLFLPGWLLRRHPLIRSNGETYGSRSPRFYAVNGFLKIQMSLPLSSMGACVGRC